MHLSKPLEAHLFYRFPFIGKVLERTNNLFQFRLLDFYRGPEIVREIKRITTEFDLQMQPLDAFTLYTLAAMQARIPGVMVEVGVYRGGSTKLLCLANQGRETFAFDTFAGLPPPSEADTQWGFPWFKQRQYTADFLAVREALTAFSNLHLVAGTFPQSGNVLQDREITFAHVDVDLYRGTLDTLTFLWPSMTQRGIILIHDSHAQGVKRAVDEFLELCPEADVFYGGASQIAIVKP
jgi:O-methyltransferase